MNRGGTVFHTIRCTLDILLHTSRTMKAVDVYYTYVKMITNLW